jgi:hypothetical protein
MPRFEIEGTTLMSWSARIDAPTRAEAIEQAQALVAQMEDPDPLAVHTLHHRITRCNAGDSPDSPDEYLPTAS